MARKRFLEELKRRHVYRVAAAYVVVGWLLIQVATQVFPIFHLPDWIDQAVVLLTLIGFPIALVLAWAFDATPRGVVATDAAAEDGNASVSVRNRSRRAGIAVGLIGVLIAVIAGAAYWHFGRTGSRAMSVKAAANAHPTRSPDGVKRNPGNATPDSAAGGAASGLQTAAQPIPAKSIAVLPFENLSTDKGNAYFADGMQDLILTKLADIGDLKVISRTSTLQYGSHPEDLKQIGQQLGVATILEGSVQKAGNQVLINVQLIDAKTDGHIWAQSYERTLDNIFGVEGEVAEKVADALNAKLSPAESARLATVPTRNPEAYNLFLRAEYMSHQGYANFDMASLRQAPALYREAIAKDPDFALAYARLSYAELQVPAWNDAANKKLVAQARNDAAHALKLQPDLVAAQVAMAYAEMNGGNSAGAHKFIAMALALEPNNPAALFAQGSVERAQGHNAAAIASYARATALDPRNLQFVTELGVTYLRIGRYPEAERWLQRALALSPSSVHAKTRYAEAILFGTGDIAGAWKVVQGDDPVLKFQRVGLLKLQRKYADALRMLDSVPDTVDNFMPTIGKALRRAELYQQMGAAAKAQPLFEQTLAAAQRQLRNEPHAESSVAPRFAIAAAELGLGQTDHALAVMREVGEIVSHNKDSFELTAFRLDMAIFYARAKRADLAVPLLVSVLAPLQGSEGRGGEDYGPVMLWLDPAWDPIRHDPGFQALLKKYAKYKPAVIPAAPASGASAASPVSASTSGNGDD